MNKKHVYLSMTFIVMLFLTGCAKKINHQSNFDFSAIEPFWKIVSVLERDEEPTDAEWDSLLLKPGYKMLLSKEMKMDWMKKYLRIAVMPSRQHEVQTWIEKGYWDAKFPLHFWDVVKQKDSIQLFVKELKKSAIQQQALKIALDYFPADMHVEELPPVSFIFFDKDARGYDPILMDAFYALEKYKTQELPYLLAHEMHHYIRNKRRVFAYPAEENTDFNLIWTFDQIHMEGIADQIDKDLMFAVSANKKRTNRYQELLLKTPMHIRQLDRLLVAYAEDSANAKEIGVAIRKAVPMSGHPMGYFMAKTILQFESKAVLMCKIGNPFAFLQRYQEAALKSGGTKPVFSEKAIALIKKLETSYVVSR